MSSKYFHYLKLNLLNREGKSLLLDLAKWSSVTIQNLTVNEYSGNLLSSQQPKTISISSSLFKNLDLAEVTPFIKIIGPSYSRPYTPLIKNSVFQNIAVKASLLLVQTNIRITLENVTIDGISKKNTDSKLDVVEYAQIRSEWIGGVCLLGKGSVVLTIKQSRITNIASHCIGLKFSTLTLTSVVFDNSALEYMPSQIPDELVNEADGVTWINLFSDGVPTRDTITSCKFISNKIPPKYGGVNHLFLAL